MSKSAPQLRAEAEDYRVLAEATHGDAMRQALLDTASALERLADDEEAVPDFSRYM